MKKAADIFIIVLLSLFMVEVEPISLNHTVCHPDGAYPQLHGLPFISHTNTPWVTVNIRFMLKATCLTCCSGASSFI